MNTVKQNTSSPYAFLKAKFFTLLAGPASFLIVLYLLEFEGLSQQGHLVLACTFWIALWWITEAIPIAVTAILPIVLFPLTGSLSLDETTACFGHKYIFLYVGGFMLAIAIERWNLHKRIALNIIGIIGTNMKSIVLGFMLATGFLSMWISNTATTVMMIPIGMAIISQLKDNPQMDSADTQTFGKMLMLSIAYSASIGGLATLIGTPPNLVLAGIIKEQYEVEITFATWMMFGLPVSVIMLAICWKYLTNYAFTIKTTVFPGGKAEIKKQLIALGKVSYEERAVFAVFILTAFAWISRSFLLERFIVGLDDTIIAVAAGLVLFVIPSSNEKDRALLTWEEAVKLPWGILLLFGGGLALAEAFKASGLAVWIGSQLSLLDGVMLILVLLILIASINFLTEITSNLATTAMILPILASLSIAINVHPYILMVGATLAASCAFMLPVATPPNAVVFGSGYLKIYDIVKAGIWLNILSIILLTLMVYFLLPYLWGFDPFSFPKTLINN